MSENTCNKCRFWDMAEQCNGKSGTCRRYAPQATVVPGSGSGIPKLIWPGTRAEEWCGEFVYNKSGQPSLRAES